MRDTNHGSARGEAERLVATVLAVASQAARGAGPQGRGGGLGDAVLGAVGRAAAGSWAGRSGAAGGPGTARPEGAGHGWATDGPDCCVCPVCRVISALRDPSPEAAERLATGAGDFAAGVASLLRSLSDVSAGAGAPAAPDADRPGDAADDGRSAWRAATRQGGRPAGSPAEPAATAPVDGDVWATATAASPPPVAPPRPMAKKAVRRAAGTAPGEAPPATPAAGAHGADPGIEA